MHSNLTQLLTLLLVYLGITLFNCSYGQSFKDLSRQADSLYRAKGPSAAEPLYLKRVELALSLHGDTSAQHLRANYDLCKVLYEQMKLDQLPKRFEYIESLLNKRNIELDPLLPGYYRIRLTHASYASDHPAGLIWAQKALDLCIRLYGENAPKTLDATNNVAFSLIRNKQYVKAKNIFLQLKDKVDKYNSKDIGSYISLYFNLAEIHEFEGDYDNAVNYFNLTKGLLEKVKDQANVLNIQGRILNIKILHLNNAANIHQWFYEYLKDCETVYGNNTHQYAKAQLHAAETFINQRLPRPAIPLLNESTEIVKRISGENSTEYAINLRALGNAYYKIRDINNALEKHNQAYNIFEKKMKSGDRETLFTLEQILNDYKELDNKHHWDSLANTYIARSKDFEGTYEDMLHVKSFLSRLYYRRGNLDLCEQYAQEYKTWVDSNQAAFKYRKLSDYWSVMTSLHQAVGNPKKSREAIIQWMEVNEQDLEHRLFGIPENDRLAFVNQLHDIQSYLLSSFFKEGSSPETSTFLYNAILKHKSLVFRSAKAYEKALSSIRDSAGIQLVNQWRSGKSTLSHLSSLSSSILKNYDYNLENLTHETQILEGKIIEQAPEISQYLKIPDHNWQDIQQALAPRTAAIDIQRFYFRREEKDPYDKIMYAAFIIRPGDTAPQLIFLENGNDLNSFLYERYRNEIQAGNKISETVYQAFWGKIEPFLKDVNALYIAPDGIFHKINLALLKRPDGKLLSEKYQINTLINLASLVRRPESARFQATTACLIGNPRFDMTMQAETPSPARSRSTFVEDYDFDPRMPILPLPETAREVEDIATFLRAKNYTVQILLDTAATVTNVQQIQQPHILHIATHGYFLKSPKREKFLFTEEMTAGRPELRSMLFFTGASNTIQGKLLPESIGDGILTALEAENLNLSNTELVVLSACDTGTGIIENGEGVFGLQRAFCAAGAKYVLISLWEVEDKQTRKFMQDFYKNYLQKNMDIPAAFHQTQMNMQQSGMSVLHWGAFVLLSN